MAKIHYYDIYASAPDALPIVRIALDDLRRQRWSQDMGQRLYDLKVAIDKETARVADERNRLLALYARRGEDGQPVKVEKWEDLADRKAFDADWAEFVAGEFEVAGLPFEAAKDRNLLGDTWTAPIWEFAPATAAPPAVEVKKNDSEASAGG